MKRSTLSLRVALLCAALPLAASSVQPAHHTATLQRTKPAGAACSAPEHHQFDFWLGDWDGFDVDKPSIVVAHNRVASILSGCVIREDYRALDGMDGQSFSIYDASRKVWHQTWVTNGGKLLVIEGRFENGEIILRGSDRTADGKDRLVRGVWKPVRDGVRETAVTSLDNGKTWQPWFDMIFRRRKP